MWKKSEVWKNNKFRFLLLVELVLLLIGGIGLLRGDREVAGLDAMQVTVNGGEYLEESGEYHINESLKSQDIFLQMTYGVISKGVYRLELSAEGTADNSLTVTAESGRFRAIRSDGALLSAEDSFHTCQFRVNGRAESAVVTVNYHGAGELSVKDLRLIRTNMGSRMFLTLTVLMSALVNVLVMLYFYMGKTEASLEKKLTWFGIPAIGLVASYPVLTDYIIGGTDSVFFANVFLILQRMMQGLGFDAVVCHNGYIVIVNLVTALLAYVSFKGIFGNGYIGVLGSLLYTLAPFRMESVFVGNALDEFTALTFFPLLLLGFYRLLEGEYHFLIPVLGFSGMLAAHAPMGLAAGLGGVLFCLLFAKRTFRKKELLQMLKTAGATLLLNLWVLVPFARVFFRFVREAMTPEGENWWNSMGIERVCSAILASVLALAVCVVIKKIYVGKNTFAKVSSVLLAVEGAILYSLYQSGEILLTNMSISRPCELKVTEQPIMLWTGADYWYALVAAGAVTAIIILWNLLGKRCHKISD